MHSGFLMSTATLDEAAAIYSRHSGAIDLMDKVDSSCEQIGSSLYFDTLSERLLLILSIH